MKAKDRAAQDVLAALLEARVRIIEGTVRRTSWHLMRFLFIKRNGLLASSVAPGGYTAGWNYVWQRVTPLLEDDPTYQLDRENPSTWHIADPAAAMSEAKQLLPAPNEVIPLVSWYTTVFGGTRKKVIGRQPGWFVGRQGGGSPYSEGDGYQTRSSFVSDIHLLEDGRVLADGENAGEFVTLEEALLCLLRIPYLVYHENCNCPECWRIRQRDIRLIKQL